MFRGRGIGKQRRTAIEKKEEDTRTHDFGLICAMLHFLANSFAVVVILLLLFFFPMLPMTSGASFCSENKVGVTEKDLKFCKL